MTRELASNTDQILVKSSLYTRHHCLYCPGWRSERAEKEGPLVNAGTAIVGA